MGKKHLTLGFLSNFWNYTDLQFDVNEFWVFLVFAISYENNSKNDMMIPLENRRIPVVFEVLGIMSPLLPVTLEPYESIALIST